MTYWNVKITQNLQKSTSDTHVSCLMMPARVHNVRNSTDVFSEWQAKRWVLDGEEKGVLWSSRKRDRVTFITITKEKEMVK